MVQFFETFVETDVLLCTTISIDFKSQISFPLCYGVGNFGKAGNFTSDSATLVCT